MHDRTYSKELVPLPSPICTIAHLHLLDPLSVVRRRGNELRESAPGPHPAASPYDKGVGAALGVHAFGVYQVELPPGAETVQHDHLGDGAEDVYPALMATEPSSSMARPCQSGRDVSSP
jgi:hypothetical protein